MQIGSKTATFYGEKYAFDWLKNDKSDYERDENRTEILWKKYHNQRRIPNHRGTAMEWVALPGTSEHQLGISVDINTDTSKYSRDDVYNWLFENSYKYGFI